MFSQFIKDHRSVIQEYRKRRNESEEDVQRAREASTGYVSPVLIISELSLTTIFASAPPGELLFKVMPRFGPVVRVGWKKTHPPAMRLALQALDDKGTLTLVRKSAIARYFTMNVRGRSAVSLRSFPDVRTQTWTKHNSEMQGLFVRLKEAEAVAIRDLCNEVSASSPSDRTRALMAHYTDLDFLA
jgi:hypothetical protein